nr:penicillin-binding transpeptidase domain-containing protein [Desulfobacula sp.]
ELNYDKEEILEAYVNEVYLGQDGARAIHGFGLAAVFYFGTSLRDARPHEIALLVGMLKGPSKYNPWRYPDRTINRRNSVLRIMGEQHLISAAQLEKELAEPLGVIKYPTQMNSPFPDYMELVKRQLLKEYREADVTSMGLRIFTALDPEIQIAAVKAVQTQLKKIAAQRGLVEEKLEASVIITATGSNEIQALIGGKNPYDNGFNRAMDARRPIGSLIKPVVYLTALSRPKTYTLITQVDDGPVTIKLTNGNDWIPKNFDRQSHGQVPLYIALINSYNTSTVRIGMDVGLKSVGETLQKLGFNKQIPLYPSSLLGSMEMSPLEVAQIYQTFAAGGFYSPARSIRAIYTSKGELLQGYPLTIEQRLEPGAVFLLNKMLQAVVLEGTAKSLKKLLPEDLGVAGKTGSTNDLKDSWFAGFTGNRLTVVWVGRDDNQSCNLTGSAGAMQIFGYLMNLIPNQPLNLVVPENVEWAIIDTNTGLRTDKTFPGALSIPFIKGSAPKHLGSYEPQAVTPQANGERKNDWNIINWLKTLIK